MSTTACLGVLLCFVIAALWREMEAYYLVLAGCIAIDGAATAVVRAIEKQKENAQ